MINGDADVNEETNGDDGGNEQKITEIRFVPVDKSSRKLQVIKELADKQPFMCKFFERH